MITHADAAQILDFSLPVALPGGGHWTARFRSWEPDRLQRIFFDVTAVGKDGVALRFEVSIPDPSTDADWASEPARARVDIDYRVRDHLGIPHHLAPFP